MYFKLKHKTNSNFFQLSFSQVPQGGLKLGELKTTVVNVISDDGKYNIYKNIKKFLKIFKF